MLLLLESCGVDVRMGGGEAELNGYLAMGGAPQKYCDMIMVVARSAVKHK
jgi:hypothetical protein